MADTERLYTDLITLLSDSAAAHSTNRQLIRDIVKSVHLYPTLGSETSVVSERYPYGHVARHGAAPANSATVNTAAILAAINSAAGPVAFDDGNYSINDELVLLSNSRVVLRPGTQITQTVANKNTFKATNKDNVWIHCNGATLYGEGSWSSGWSSISGHEDRGIQFRGCTNSGVTYPRLRNHALASICILGGTNILVDTPIIEGTHALGHPLTAGVSNYQFGVLVIHDATYGAFQGVHIKSPTIFNVAQGINTVENIANSSGLLEISDPLIYNVIGQHGCYIGTSNTTIANPTIDNCGLDGIKIYSGANNEQLKNVVITDFNISNCTVGQAVELGVSGSGYILAPRVTGTSYNCARTLTLDGDIRGAVGKINSDTVSQYALLMQGTTGPTDCDIEVVSRNATLDGVNVASSTSARNRIRAKVYRPSRGAGARRGVYVNACASLVLENMECIDDDAKMAYGCFLDVNATNVRFTGTVRCLGYVTNGIRVDGTSEWHASGGEFTSLQTAFFGQSNHIEPVSALKVGRQTTVNANVPIWQLTLDDESVYLVSAKLAGKLSGSTERAGFVSTAVFYRDAAGTATLQGSADEDVNIKSASFVGTYTWSPTSNDARLLVNSTTTATYDWRAEISVVKMSP